MRTNSIARGRFLRRFWHGPRHGLCVGGRCAGHNEHICLAPMLKWGGLFCPLLFFVNLLTQLECAPASFWHQNHWTVGVETDIAAYASVNNVVIASAGVLLKIIYSEADSNAECLAEARCVRRQRKLDQIEIPENHVTISDELLGIGGFGEVYIADYNGHNAAAKGRPLSNANRERLAQHVICL